MYEADLSNRRGVPAPLTAAFFAWKGVSIMNDTQSKPIADYAISNSTQNKNLYTEWQAGVLLLTLQRRIAGITATLAEPYISEPVIEALQKLNEARIEEFMPTRADADLWESWNDATAAGLNGTGWSDISEADLITAAAVAIQKDKIPMAQAAQTLLVASGYTPEDVKRIFIQQKNDVK